MKISELMKANLLSVRPETKVSELLEIFADQSISGIPVVGEAGDLRGLVSKTDLVRLHARGHNLAASGTQVWEIMTTEVLTVSPDDDVRAAARAMVDQRVHRAVVCAQERVVGIVSSFDMMSLLADGY